MELLGTKKIDELGRISLSEKSRKEMGWATGDILQFIRQIKIR